MNNYVKLGIVIGLISVGWFSRAWYEDSVSLKIEQVKTAVAAINAEAIAGIRVENKTITAKTVERIKTETVYKDCVADQGMMDLTNNARGF